MVGKICLIRGLIDCALKVCMFQYNFQYATAIAYLILFGRCIGIMGAVVAHFDRFVLANERVVVVGFVGVCIDARTAVAVEMRKYRVLDK